MAKPRPKGFTLAELLIALAILGVIATFTIPKVLQSKQNAAWSAEGKEVAGIIAQGAQKYQMEKGFTANTTPYDIMNSGYVNYVSLQTTPIDRVPGTATGTPPGSISCTGANTCYVMHNGGVLLADNVGSFSNNGLVSTSHALYFTFDPDAKPTGTTNGPGKSVEFVLYYTGRLISTGQGANTWVCDYWSGCWNVGAQQDPDWFSWN